MERKPCVYFLPIYAPGHLISMVEAAKRLLQSTSTPISNFSITFLLMQPPNPESSSPLSNSYLQSAQTLNLPIHFLQLPSVEPPSTFNGPEDFISHYTELHLPHIKTAIQSSHSPPSALVLDLFCTSAIDVAKELDIPSYIFFSSTATCLALMLHLKTLDEKFGTDFWDLEETVPIQIPGIAPVPAISMPKPVMSKKLSSYKWFLHHGSRYVETKGIIVNSNLDLEPKSIQALNEGQLVLGKTVPEIFPVGPIITIGKEDGSKEKHECLKWLDEQSEKSVVFLCFGSRGAFETCQVHEMAVALDRTGHRFLWALRSPGQGIKFPTDAKLDELLPEGFMERTKERGLVWPSWVPQIEILAHPSVGGFMTHCGWNSVMESLWFGVPMIPWPIYAEQHLNAFEMVNEMCVAVNLKVDRKNNNFVKAEELERAIRCLMEDIEEGGRVRVRAEEMKNACRKAVEKGGSSHVHLQRIAKQMSKLELEN
ncbi:hypothetical protein LUZ60_005429 [Juncus effusus]|nr:hypothetical protein LUZ60_005429 [Juncus effusus]